MSVNKLRAAACMIFVSSFTASAAEPPAWTTPSTEQISVIQPDVESLYLDLHRNPELSKQEQWTAAKLAARVQALGAFPGPYRHQRAGLAEQGILAYIFCQEL